jgi:hypothetical protein
MVQNIIEEADLTVKTVGTPISLISLKKTLWCFCMGLILKNQLIYTQSMDSCQLLLKDVDFHFYITVLNFHITILIFSIDNQKVPIIYSRKQSLDFLVIS